MKKYIFSICLCLSVLCTSCIGADVSAKSAFLYDCFADKTVYEKSADIQLPMASTTKIMTALLSCELYDLEQTVTVKPEWCGIEGSSMYLEPGETLKIKELLYGLLLMSGNDAAAALASIYTGDQADFVAMMNQKAEELGLQNTHFTNPSGLSEDGHYTTAKDLCMLARAALNNQYFATICGTKQAQVAGRFMANHNKLLFTLNGAVGVKTGWTEASGRCLVSAVVRNGRKLIAVTLDAPDDWNDHEKLYRDGYSGMNVRSVVKKGIIGYAYIAGKGTTPICLNDEISAFLSDAELKDIKFVLTGPRIIYEDVRSGEKFGVLSVTLNGRIIASAPVYFTENISYFKPETSFWDKIF